MIPIGLWVGGGRAKDDRMITGNLFLQLPCLSPQSSRKACAWRMSPEHVVGFRV